MTISLSQIQTMSPQERLQTMEALWDAITHDQPEPSSPSWHQEVLQARQAKANSEEAEWVSLEQLKDRSRR